MIYKSVRNSETLPPAAVQGLVDQASPKNEKAGITGILLVSGNRFMQVLEGPVSFVNQLYAKIVADGRHHSVELISYESITSTMFPDWSMKVLKLDEDLPTELQRTLVNKYSELDGHILFPDDLPHVHALLLDARWGLLKSGQAG